MATSLAAQRSKIARIGGLALAASADPRAYTARARAAFLQKFLDQVDPERSLPQAERERRALAARKLHFARMGLAAAQRRRLQARRLVAHPSGRDRSRPCRTI